MPSPLGHALGGAIVALLTAPRNRASRLRLPVSEEASARQAHPPHQTHQTYLTWCVVAGCLPDIDFFWGRHNAETHSLGFAVLTGVAVVAITKAPRLGLACALAV